MSEAARDFYECIDAVSDAAVSSGPHVSSVGKVVARFFPQVTYLGSKLHEMAEAYRQLELKRREPVRPLDVFTLSSSCVVCRPRVVLVPCRTCVMPPLGCVVTRADPHAGRPADSSPAVASGAGPPQRHGACVVHACQRVCDVCDVCRK